MPGEGGLEVKECHPHADGATGLSSSCLLLQSPEPPAALHHP